MFYRFIVTSYVLNVTVLHTKSKEKETLLYKCTRTYPLQQGTKTNTTKKKKKLPAANDTGKDIRCIYETYTAGDTYTLRDAMYTAYILPVP